jgi:hypothetical protein
MAIDMEAPQVQGACDSFLPVNEPEYSGITTADPDGFALYFVRACISHCKRYAPPFAHETLLINNLEAWSTD